MAIRFLRCVAQHAPVPFLVAFYCCFNDVINKYYHVQPQASMLIIDVKCTLKSILILKYRGRGGTEFLRRKGVLGGLLAKPAPNVSEAQI